jgi:hypothetical protein
MIGLGVIVGGQLLISAGIGSVIGWEIGKKLNYKIYGNRSRFIPKDTVVCHKKWKDIK